MSFRVSMQEVPTTRSRHFKDPVEVEFITAWAARHRYRMHVKHVQVPIRPILRELGGAHVKPSPVGQIGSVRLCR